jgi:hypothetical protein
MLVELEFGGFVPKKKPPSPSAAKPAGDVKALALKLPHSSPANEQGATAGAVTCKTLGSEQPCPPPPKAMPAREKMRTNAASITTTLPLAGSTPTVVTPKSASEGPAAPANATGWDPGPATTRAHAVLKKEGAGSEGENATLSTRLFRVSPTSAALAMGSNARAVGFDSGVAAEAVDPRRMLADSVGV